MPIKESITVDDALEVLNRMLKTDPEATKKLVIDGQVTCNEALSEDPTIQVRGYARKGAVPPPAVGILGVINGLFGVDDKGVGPIAVKTTVGCPNGHDGEGIIGMMCGGMWSGLRSEGLALLHQDTGYSEGSAIPRVRTEKRRRPEVNGLPVQR